MTKGDRRLLQEYTERVATPADLANPLLRKGRPVATEKSTGAIIEGDLGNDPREIQIAQAVIPARWDGYHVGARLREAFGVLRRQPAKLGPREFGVVWPAYEDEWAKEIAAIRAWMMGISSAEQMQMAVDGKSWDEINRMLRENTEEEARHRVALPSITEVTRMEAALHWSAHYLGHRNHNCMVAVQRVALAHSLGFNTHWVAKRFGLEPETWQRRNWEGCTRIAEGLERDRVVVF